MNRIRHDKRLKSAAYITVVFAFVMVLVFCFSMIDSINQRMNESATSNLLNTTRVIEGNLESLISKDFQSLEIVGELYKRGERLESGRIKALCDTMGFEWIGVTDEKGKGVDYFAETFKISDIPFYEGAGRTYVFDGTDGKWIQRSLGTDGASKRQEDIYSLLLNSGNGKEKVRTFQQAVNKKKTGTAVFKFNGEQSYVCFMPLSSSEDWYVATVIPGDILLKESAQVQQMIQMIFAVFCVALLAFTVLFAAWKIRRTKEKEKDYREALFVNISSNIDSAFLIYDKNSSETAFVSENVERLLGLNRDWLRENAGYLFEWCGIEKDDPDRTAFLNGKLSSPVIREVCMGNKIGEESRYIRLELIPADMEQEIAVLTDITKDKDIQRSLLDAMQRAEAASNAKNDFLSSMSHDIRTPMNGIVGMTAIAGANLNDRSRVKDCLTKINEASAHLLNLINEVLDMSQIESGKMELTEEPFNLPGLLQEVVSINYPGIRQRNHQISVHIHSMESEQVIGDPVRLRRVVSNLISNAVKYTPDGGKITLSLEEKQEMLKGYGCYELMVQDNGIGMSPEFQKKLFQPFEREEDVRISKIQGTGLGMSIVKNIVSLMMGDIQVESEKNHGSTFRVTLNLKLDKQEEGEDKKLAGLPVLVVDDDRIVCKTVTSMLSSIGMIGEWTDNGTQAVKKAVERHRRDDDYLAVLLDWKMPDIDGVETARRIRRQLGRKVPIIILTAYDWGEIESEAREAGVDAFISKPIYKTKLRQKMLTVVQGDKEIKDPETLAEIDGNEIPKGKKVLLAEDNELNMEIASELLKMLGITVYPAENGAVAVEQFAESRPGTYDMILMDIQMPKMNGYEATEAIRNMDRSDSRTIPIVAMTADAFAKDVQAVHAKGMNEHISKPISIECLKQVLIRFLSK